MALANSQPRDVDLPEHVRSVRLSVEWISPETAKVWLGRNLHNRPLKFLKIDQISRDILEGRYMLNGETIKFSLSDVLLDGQNRLHAIIKAGEGVWSVVVRGLAEDAQETVDIGVVRALSDELSLRREASSSTLAAGLVAAWRLSHNGHLFGGAGIPWPSREELLTYFDENPGIRDSVRRADSLRKAGVRYPAGLASALHYLFSQRDSDQADDFWRTLEEGVGLRSGDPILTLRNYLIRDLAATRRMDALFRAAITIKAWNAYRLNKSVHQIKWRRGGDKAEDFPAIR